MEVIKVFIEKVIYVAIVAIIIELILPKGNTKKYIYVVLSLFMLLNILSPIVDVIKDNSMQSIFDNVLETISGNVQNSTSSNIEEFSEYKKDKILESVKEKLEYEIEFKLKEKNIEVKKVKLDLKEDYSLNGLEVNIKHLDVQPNKKAEKISDVIMMLSEDYMIDKDNIKIIEEGI